MIFIIFCAATSALILSDSMKEDANFFIPREHSNFLKLLRTSPDIDPSSSKDADIAYTNFIKIKSSAFSAAESSKIADDRIDIA